MRLFIFGLLLAISYAQTAYLDNADFDTWDDFDEHLSHPCSHTPHPCKNGATKCEEYLGEYYEEEWADTFVRCECADGYFGDTCENVHDPHPAYNNVAIKIRETGEIVPASCGRFEGPYSTKILHGRVAMYEGFKACVDFNQGPGNDNFAVQMCNKPYQENFKCCQENELLTRDLTRNGFQLHCTEPAPCTENGKPGYMDVWDDEGDMFEVCDIGEREGTEKETKVGFNAMGRECDGQITCIHACHQADGSKTKRDCMEECPRSICEDTSAHVLREKGKGQNLGTNLRAKNEQLRKANNALQKLLKELN